MVALLTQAVLGAVLAEAEAGIDHHETLAAPAPSLSSTTMQAREAGAVEQVGEQADDALMARRRIRLRRTAPSVLPRNSTLCGGPQAALSALLSEVEDVM